MLAKLPTMPVSILTLPPELLDRITKESNYASTLAPRYTCRELYMKIAPMAGLGKILSNRGYGMCDILEIEKWPCYDPAGDAEDHLKQPLATRDFFACSYCLKIRCASKFSKAMMKGKRGKRSSVFSETDERRHRFCIDCGVAYGRYLPGVRFEFGGARISDDVGGGYGLVCYECRKFKRIYSELEQGERECQACFVATKRS